jgi:hypothetical protein
MVGQRLGYIRVSTLDQHTERQLEGIEVDKTFLDKASGKDTKRPQLDLLMRFVRSGDTVIVHSMDRLARNLDDLRRIVQTLTGKGVKIEFVGIPVRRDNLASVVYSTELHSTMSLITPPRTDRYGILDKKPSHFQLFS